MEQSPNITTTIVIILQIITITIRTELLITNQITIIFTDLLIIFTLNNNIINS